MLARGRFPSARRRLIACGNLGHLRSGRGYMSETDGQSPQDVLDEFSPTHRIWVLPILRTLDELGGQASPRAVVARIRETVASTMRPLQWARIRNGRHIRWTRVTMKEKGLDAG